jgi:hypothetical protein
MKSIKKNPYPNISLNIFDLHKDEVKQQSKKIRSTYHAQELEIDNTLTSLNQKKPSTTTAGEDEVENSLNFDRTIHKRTCTIKRSSRGNFTYAEEDEIEGNFDVVDLYRDSEHLEADYNDSFYSPEVEFPDTIAPWGLQALQPMKKGKILLY